MDKTQLKEFVLQNSKLVSIRGTEKYPELSILKYRKSVFYDNLWNNFLEECRGTVIDQDWNPVVRPFTKIYNFGIESKAPVIRDDEMVTAYRKVNGFMASLTWYKNDVLISTTGSLDSEFVEMARTAAMTYTNWDKCRSLLKNLEGWTLLFEVCHPDDPHIIPEVPGLYLIGKRENTWNSLVQGWNCGYDFQGMARDIGCFVPEFFHLPFGEIRKMAQECRHEGFVVYTNDGRCTKIKSPWYLTNKWVARNPRTDKLVDTKRDIKKSIDEEYHGLIDKIRANIVEYTAMNEQERLSWVRRQLS